MGWSPDPFRTVEVELTTDLHGVDMRCTLDVPINELDEAVVALRERLLALQEQFAPKRRRRKKVDPPASCVTSQNVPGVAP